MTAMRKRQALTSSNHLVVSYHILVLRLTTHIAALKYTEYLPMTPKCGFVRGLRCRCSASASYSHLLGSRLTQLVSL